MKDRNYPVILGLKRNGKHVLEYGRKMGPAMM